MKYMKRSLALLLAVVLTAVLLAGCGGNKSMTLRVCLQGVPATLDPAMVSSETESILVGHLYENLMKLSWTAESGLQAVAGVAKSYDTQENLDGTQTYTFQLRSNAQWSDGQKVTAADFVYAWRRLVDPATDSPNAQLLDMVVGYDKARKGDLESLQVTAVDDATLSVTLAGPCAHFITAICTAPATMPVRQDAAAEENWSMSSSTLKANGPYSQVSEWKSDALTAVVQKGYYDAKRLGPVGLQFLFAENASVAEQLYQEGQADFVLGTAEGTVDPLPRMSILALNQMSQVLASQQLRQAMDLVIDRTALAKLAEVPVLPAEGLIPYGVRSTAGTPFRSEKTNLLVVDEEEYEHRCQQAKELLRQAGAIPGNLSLVYEAGSGREVLVTYLRDTWQQKLGLTVALQPVTGQQKMEILNSGEYTMALVEVVGRYNDSTALLNCFASGVAGNWANYHNSAYDMLLRVAEASHSAEARDAYLVDAERLLLEDAYVMPLWGEAQNRQLADGLTGVFSDGVGTYYFTAVRRAQ